MIRVVSGDRPDVGKNGHGFIERYPVLASIDRSFSVIAHHGHPL
jgi:hypothetical protein